MAPVYRAAAEAEARNPITSDLLASGKGAAALANVRLEEDDRKGS
jgi:hypothetical protein